VNASVEEQWGRDGPVHPQTFWENTLAYVIRKSALVSAKLAESSAN
jgi:hypothetical protein